MGGLIVALPRKEWGGSEGCSLPGKWKHSFDAKPVHSHFASFGYGSPGGFSCSLFGSWTPTPSSHLGNVVGRSQPCAIWPVICMKGRPGVCKLISGSSCSTVRGRISRSPCLGRGSCEAFLSSSSRVPRPGAELEQPRHLAQGRSSSCGSRGEGFPLYSCGSLNPAVFPEPFTLALGTTNISGPCGWRDPRQWCGCHVGRPPASVCLLSCRPVPGAPWEVAPVSWLKDAVAGWGRRGEKSLERHVWCFVWF